MSSNVLWRGFMCRHRLGDTYAEESFKTLKVGKAEEGSIAGDRVHTDLFK